MGSTTIREFTKLVKKDDFSILELSLIFTSLNLEDTINSICDLINDNLEELYENGFFLDYHLFLYMLISKTRDTEELYQIRFLCTKSLKIIKEYIKPYNKGEKEKDKKFYCLSNECDSIKRIIDSLVNNILYDKSNTEEFKIMWFLVSNLKDPNYIYRILELHPDYTNLHDLDNIHIFIRLIRTMCICDNIEDTKNYKRILVMFLESDNLKLSNDELYSILEELENSLMTNDLDKKKVIKFVINEIERHYEIINTDSRMICIDYAKIPCPTEIVRRGKEERVDLTNLFAFSIDSVRKNDFSNVLIDDAISIEKISDGVNIYIHIPDVDYFINKDSITDKYMRNIGESIYVKGYKHPMIDHDIALGASLIHGNVRPALTFVIKLDNKGNVENIDFLKSLVNINWNFTKSYAEYFYKNSEDKILKDALHLAKRYATLLRKNRKLTVKNIRTSSLIMEEMNVLLDVTVAKYFKDNGIVFPYKNYLGKRLVSSAKDVDACAYFSHSEEISENGRNILYSVFDIYNRVYYDTVSIGNKAFGGVDSGNVGNPLREYISLETDRLIKDIIISKEENYDYWQERIERDCIEYTETSAKIRSLYSHQ